MSAHTERGIVTKYVCCPRRTRDRLRSKIARREAVVVESRSTSRGQIINGENWTRRISWPPTDTAWHVNAAVSVRAGERLPVVFIRPGLDDVAPSLSRTRPHLRHASVHPPSPSVEVASIRVYINTRIRFTNISAASVRDEVPVSARDTSLSRPRLFFAFALRRWAVMIFFATENRESTGREEKKREGGKNLIVYVNYSIIELLFN